MRGTQLRHHHQGPGLHSLLLIEDNPDDIEAIMRSLGRIVAQDEIVLCRDGVTALDYLFCRAGHSQRNPKEQPRLVMLDRVLPRMSGFEVLREIRAGAHTRLVPVVLLSASGEPEDIRAAARFGANSYVRKSADGAVLGRTVELLARYWLELNIPPPAELD